jgi:hypothetical protein
MPKTEAGKSRQYHALYNQYRRAYDGGGCFGFDLPTMHAQEPEVWARMRALCGIKEGDSS